VFSDGFFFPAFFKKKYYHLGGHYFHPKFRFNDIFCFLCTVEIGKPD